MTVSELWIYPIKSCRGIAVNELVLDDRGPVADRRWMLVDAAGRFISQREVSRLALIDVALDGEYVRAIAPGMSELAVHRDQANAASTCSIWNDSVELQHVSVDADQWFSAFLGFDCRLMRMPTSTERVVDRDYSPERRLVSLADAFPMLLIGEGSLALLNEKLAARGESTISMRRFRPNVVVAGTQAHEEDEWTEIRIGDVACKVVKPCARCAITTVDIETGEKGIEPLKTLASYRKSGSKVLFGQNVIHAAPGVISLGSSVVPSHTEPQRSQAAPQL